MKDQNILYYGTAQEAAAELDYTEPSNLELRAALMNALNRIAILEKQIASMRDV